MISPFEFKSTHCLAVAVALFASLIGSFETASAQQSAEEKKYDAAIAQGRVLAKACRSLSLKFFDVSLADSKKYKKQWPAAAKAIADHKPVIEQAAIDWFMKCPKPDEELLRVVSAVSSEKYDAGDFETSWTLLQKIAKFFPEPDNIRLQRRMALVAIKTNRFEYALDFLSNPKSRESIEELEVQLDKNLFALCPLLAHKWKREQELQEKETEADDLPRVKIQLSTGEVIVELFENEAPQTVANFISQVESGFYDESYCHPHVKNIVMQTGIVNRTRSVPVIDYKIKNESRSDISRDHFSGSLSMASFDGKDASATVFVITLLPNPDLDWNRTEEDNVSQTVFGRVISGMGHVAALPVTMEVDPETEEQTPIKGVTPGHIEKASVIRKREHEYTFEKIRRQKE